METYIEPEYANNRLTNTIVRVKGTFKSLKPILVCGIDADNIVLYRHLSQVEGKIEKCTLENLEISPVPLGYINCYGYAYYGCRRPMRQDWKQGLRSQNLLTYTNGEKCAIEWAVTFYKSLGECIEGKYPSFKVAIEKTVRNPTGKFSGMAFSRDFSVNKNGGIRYKDHLVGAVDSNNNVLFNEGYEFVEESFHEATYG